MDGTPRSKSRKLIIIGDSAFAEIACEYFTQDTDYEVVAFAVEAAYLKRNTLFDRPVVPFEELAQRFSPQSHWVFVAIVYTQLNRLRSRLLGAAMQAGFAPASYVSPQAFVWSNVKLGEHCFIFEHNVVQPFVTVGHNVILWSGNHIGHHSRIDDNVFVSSHVVVSGFCTIGANSFLGVNAAIANNVTIGKDCWIGPGAVVSKDTNAGEIRRAPESEAAKVSAMRFFKVSD
jgi:sugar O-acyltransferase (sialic acid O-acetyltransferase NeuD family)